MDVRFEAMTPLLSELLRIKTFFIDDFYCSIRLAVGEDDDSAHIHGWAQFTHVGRTTLTVTQFPHEVQGIISNLCGVKVSFNTEELDSNWLPVLTGSGRFDIAVEKEQDWKTLPETTLCPKTIHNYCIDWEGTSPTTHSSKRQTGNCCCNGAVSHPFDQHACTHTGGPTGPTIDET
jgi:hypothetical protein